MKVNTGEKNPEFLMSENTMTVILNGDIDHHSSKKVRAKIDSEMFIVRPKNIIMDLSKVEFMDSSGLGLILGRYTKAGEIGCDFKLTNPNEKVKKILDLAGVERIIGMIPTTAATTIVVPHKNMEAE